MKLFIDAERFTVARKTRQPRMSWTQGRGWDLQTKSINGRNVQFHFECARGTQMYFKYEDAWYVARMFQDYDPFDFSTFFTTPPPNQAR